MAKIALRYVGDDEGEIKRLEATGGVRFFEPVDAKEVLANEDHVYVVDEDHRKLIGSKFEPGGSFGKGLSIPQLQGNDTELQTGLSADKYGRSQVVQGVPDDSSLGVAGATADRPMTTDGHVLTKGEATPSDNNPNARKGHEAGKASEGLNKAQLKAALDSRGVQYDAGASRDELAESLDASGAHK